MKTEQNYETFTDSENFHQESDWAKEWLIF